MAKVKDIIVKCKDGLYVMRRRDGHLGFSTKPNATHFTGKSKVREEFPSIVLYDVRYLDLNRKKDFLKCQKI